MEGKLRCHTRVSPFQRAVRFRRPDQFQVLDLLRSTGTLRSTPSTWRPGRQTAALRVGTRPTRVVRRPTAILEALTVAVVNDGSGRSQCVSGSGSTGRAF